MTRRPRDDTRPHNFRLGSAEWDALERIAVHHGSEWGGIPSRSEAIRLLIRRELERLDAGGSTFPGAPPGERRRHD